MNIHAGKTTENKKRTISDNLTQKKHSALKKNEHGSAAFEFTDNRPETLAQRKLQTWALTAPSTDQALQLKSILSRQSENFIQRESVEEEELLQGKFNLAQKKELEEEELLQGKFKIMQKKEIDEEELLQGKFEPVQKQENNTGLPDQLKSGIENLSGLSLDDVQVHYNSDKPAGMQAHAYAQGTDIHLAPGQEKHLPHEAWHVVQQKQGRVKPTMQLQGKVNVNDDEGLEKEADVMGAKAMQLKTEENNQTLMTNSNSYSIQFILRNPNDSKLNARLTKEYHEAENNGDACSPASNSIEVHKEAIEHYKRAKTLRRQAGKLHLDDDGGHLIAIQTLDDKIIRRKQLIADLTPKTPAAKPKATASEKKGKSNWFGHEPMGTGGQASWLPGNQSAWEPRKFGT